MELGKLLRVVEKLKKRDEDIKTVKEGIRTLHARTVKASGFS
jgi:hypothetical protein